MKINKIDMYYKTIFIFFIFIFLLLFFFSTSRIEAKAFEINNVEISKPFKIEFNKNKVIDEGFIKAFSKLVFLIPLIKKKLKISN